MPDSAFVSQLNEQVAYEFAAHQQYIANAVYYDAETMPRLAAFFYAQAVEERDHALMMIQYLIDADAQVTVPGVEAPRTTFADIAEPVEVALEQEKRVSDQIGALAGLARDGGDYLSEQFLQWFLKEQVEEVATMSSLLTVVRRSRERPMDVEEYLAREGRPTESDPTAPPVAGGE